MPALGPNPEVTASQQQGLVHLNHRTLCWTNLPALPTRQSFSFTEPFSFHATATAALPPKGLAASNSRDTWTDCGHACRIGLGSFVPSAEVELGSTRLIAGHFSCKNKFQYQRDRGEQFSSVNDGGGFYRLLERNRRSK
jgi:hypothetical protein